MSDSQPNPSVRTFRPAVCRTGVLLTATVLGLLLPSSIVAQVDFEKEIKPIFENHCIACHGPSDAKAFRIDDADETFDFILEEDAEESRLYQVLIAEEESEIMPPPNVGRPMTAAQIELVKTWINEGASWPEELSSEWNDVALPEPEKENVPLRAAGSLHPAVVHLPIGLLLASGLFAFLSLRGNFVMSDCAYYCLWLGALGAIGACASGWFYSEMEGYGTVSEIADVLDQDNKMYWHRITGLGAAAFALILALFAANARSKDPDDGIIWKLGAMLLAGLIGYVGHEGGHLQYGPDHYKDLNKLVESFFEKSVDDDDDPGVDDPQNDQPTDDDEDKVQDSEA